MKSITVQSMIDSVIEIEGGYVNNPLDPGGATKYGVTLRAARADGYMGNMKDYPREKAFDLYRRVYFVKPGMDKVFECSPIIAAKMFDAGINISPKKPIEFLQKCLNALNGYNRPYPDIATDGIIGPSTINLLKHFLADRLDHGEKTLFKAMDGLQAAYYINLANEVKSSRAFAYGWIANRIGLGV